jgi:tRNA(fMet)-specific endonuclease VapC
MSVLLLDTDTLTSLEHRHAVVLQNVNARPIADINLSVISLQEQMQGFLASVNRARDHRELALAYEMLVMRLLPLWGRFAVLPFTEPAILRFEQLRSMRLNVGLMDLRIAAIALENHLTVVTRNQRDFGRVLGLAIVDWSV